MIIWISAGANSAVAAMLTLRQRADVRLVRIWMPDEDPDNDRFCVDLERWLGAPIITVSSLWRSVEDVARARKFISSVHGAPCTLEMKKFVRHYIERYVPDAYEQAFGYAVEERIRFERMRAMHPELILHAPLIDAGLTSEDCRALLLRVGIALPRAYQIGLQHNNCIGCLKAGSRWYWSIIRQHYPDVFARRAQLERDLGYTFLRDSRGAPVLLDDADLGAVVDDGDAPSCSLWCYAVLQD